MRLFYVAHFDCAAPAGHATHVRGVVNELARQGHEVWLFASGWNDQSGSRVRFVPVRQVRAPGLYALSFGLSSLLPVLWQALRRRPQAIYSRFYTALWPLVLLARALGIPLAIEVNSDLENERQANRQGPWKRRVGNWLEGLAYRWATGVVVVTPAIAQSIRARFRRVPAHIAVIPNGADVDVFRPRDAATCRRQLGLPVDGRYITYVGAFQSWQGLSTLVAAAAQVPDATFLLVGDGPERAAITSQIARLGLDRRVQVVSRQAPRQAACYMGAADVCAAPYTTAAASAGESGAPMARSPLKIYSYLACGRPVVASHFQEAGAFVQQLGAGLAVPPEDASALARAIQSLLADPALAQQMGRAGRLAVAQRHSWAEVTRQIVAYLHSITRVSHA